MITAPIGYLGDALVGIKVIIENKLGWKSVQYFFPKSKSKRIRAKCAKKYRRRVQDPICYQIPSMFGEPMFIMNDAAKREILSGEVK